MSSSGPPGAWTTQSRLMKSLRTRQLHSTLHRGRRHVTRALQWKGGVFHDRLATCNELDLADLARLRAKLNES